MMNNLTRGVLPTSNEISNNPRIAVGSGVQANRGGERLANDLLGIMKSVSNFVEEENTLSIKAAQRVANDSLTQMALDISAIESRRTPNTDLRQEQIEIENVYLQYGRKNFDTEDSQRAFDEIYHRQGALSVAEKSATLNRQALQKDAESLHSKTIYDIQQQANAGLIVSHEQILGGIDSLKGWYDPKQIASEFVNTSIQAFEGRFETLESLDVYQDNGINLDMTKLDNAANKYFGAYATIKNGEWVGKSGVPVGAVAAAQDAFNRFVDTNRTNREKYKGKTIIPQVTASIKPNGTMTSQQAIQQVGNIQNEIVNKTNTFGESYVSSSEYFTSVTNLAQAQAKVNQIISLENNFNKAVVGEINFNDFLNYNYEQQVVTIHGQELIVSLPNEDVQNFFQSQLQKQELNAKNISYEEGKSQNGINIFNALGRIETESGLKGNLFSQDTTNVLNGRVEGVDYAQIKDSVRKVRDYSQGTQADNWLTAKGSSQAIEALFTTLDKEIEAGNIKEKDAILTAKSVLFSYYNDSKGKTIYKSDEPLTYQVQKEVTSLMQNMDNFIGKGWFTFEAGNQESIEGYSKAALSFIGNQGYTNTDRAVSAIQERTIQLRVDNPIIPFFRKAFPVFTGNTPINPIKASEALTQRLAEDETLHGLGEDFSDNNVKIIQTQGNNGEFLLRVQVRDPNNPYALLREQVFTTAQLNRGATKQEYVAKDKNNINYSPESYWR